MDEEIPQSTSLVESPDPQPEIPHEKSLIDMAPKGMAEKIARLPESLTSLTEHEIKKLTYGYHKGDMHLQTKAKEQMLKTDTALRWAFWREYEAAQNAGRRMLSNFIYGMICEKNHFHNFVTGNPHRLAFIICPPGDYMANLTDVLQDGVNRIREIFNLPIASQVCRCHWVCVCKHPDGMTRLECKRAEIKIACICKTNPSGCVCPKKYDPRIADVILRAIERVEQRVKGSVVQKIDQRALNVNVSRTLAPGEDLPTDMNSVEKRIRELEEITRTHTPESLGLPSGEEPIVAEFTEKKE